MIDAVEVFAVLTGVVETGGRDLWGLTCSIESACGEGV